MATLLIDEQCCCAPLSWL